MTIRRWIGCLFGLAALVTATAARAAEDDRRRRPGPAPAISEPWVIAISPETGVIIDDQRTPPADVEGRVFACMGMPGCQAVWQEGGNVVLILGFEWPEQ